LLQNEYDKYRALAEQKFEMMQPLECLVCVSLQQQSERLKGELEALQ